jgi:hypothetical protein
MTPQKTFHRKKKAFHGAMGGYGFDGILGTGRIVTAVTGHHGAYCVLIDTDGQEQQFAH